MGGEASPMSGSSQRADKRSYKDLKMDVEEMEEPDLDFEESSKKKLHKEPGGLINKICKHSGNTEVEPELFGAESCSFLPAYPVCMSGDRREERGEEASPTLLYWVYPDNQHNRALCPVSRTIPPVTHRPRPVISAPSPGTVIASKGSSVVNLMVSSPITDHCSPSSSMCGPTSSACNTLRSTYRSPGCSAKDLVSAAAHLHLLGESLSLIGQHLQETNKMVSMSISLSLLLDSLLCALAPLICLSAQIPELRSCTQHTLASTLENIAYLMPGL
ncbi:hypothetical protein PBY51_020199 [Eleginops maclovinus]|uniref:Uncharacterized protein n=1 Tax=Eleginops maclovinus TaxID=56733 RepID=A0AAN7XPK6_ELEMC|nr:hypothetical protein PBY51_020199 [Eleginops maclovinus]